MPLEMFGQDRAYLRGSSSPEPRGGPSVRIVDLFSGCGGMTLGAAEAARACSRQADVRLAVERDVQISATYARNFSPAYGTSASSVEEWFDGDLGARLSLTERRARRLVGQVDVLLGGPPCQGHSTLNNYTRGNDPKNALYLRMVRAARVLEPTSVIIENVPALERDAGRTLDSAQRGLEALGYKVDARVICVADLGVPQLRKRHVLVAHRDVRPKLADAIARARPTRTRTLRWAIGDLMTREGRTLFDTAALLSPTNLARARFLLKRGLYDLPNPQRPLCQRGAHKYKSMYGRLDWDRPAQTITTGFGSPGQGRYLHPERLRTLTPHEAARIQFFPDWFDFSTLSHRKVLAEAIGNAVPPKLSFVLVAHLLALSSRPAKTIDLSAAG